MRGAARAPPALTRIEAGEGCLTLRWTLEAEPELTRYRLYRSRSAVRLQDLRWFRASAEERVIDLPDPRLRVHGNALRIPKSVEVAEVIAVVRAEQHGAPRPFDHLSREPLHASQIERAAERSLGIRGQPSWVAGSTSRVISISQLRALADGAAVVLVYRNSAGEERTLGALSDGGVYVDADTRSATSWFYRLVAIDSAGNVSAGSAIIEGRAFDTSVPVAPPLAASVHAEPLAVHLAWTAGPGVQHLVQRYVPGNFTWIDRSGWLASGVARYEDTDVRAGQRCVYRLRVRSAAGLPGREHTEAVVDLPG